MAGRIYQACGLTYSLRSECALESEDFAKLATLAKIEKQAQETRQAIVNGAGGEIIEPCNMPPGGRLELKQLAQALERQEARAKRLRGELKEVLA